MQRGEITRRKPKAEKLRAILSSEYSARLWPKLRRYAKGEIRTGLNKIEKPINDDTGEIDRKSVV